MTETAPPAPWRVEFYATGKNKSPVLDFINGLPEQERAKVRTVLQLLREFGTLLSLPHSRPISGRSKLRELRAGDVRLFYFAHTGRRFIILHGFRKKSQKTPPAEIATAERRMKEFLEAEK
ncbi:MAG TPA: type II toxin-antitoxin system RelE/ParE family toxin [Pyrinomonadaceae bacterium]|nr:type II toxin-antitoxin system RelE/ParE family toxin [Pyrinomonadaceae bacterium]HLE62730.1 type II toxin-antitoxin system RelE/ParE family toxin [Pyrinomonadaceae bacterium]